MEEKDPLKVGMCENLGKLSHHFASVYHTACIALSSAV
jgi:hypothetical protein